MLRQPKLAMQTPARDCDFDVRTYPSRETHKRTLAHNSINSSTWLAGTAAP